MRRASLGAVVMLAASACVACGTSGNAPLGASPSKAQSNKPEQGPTTQTADDFLVLGPDGVGPLRLGMSHQEVVDTGAAQATRGSRHDGWPSGCRVLQYRPERLGRVPATP